MIPRIYSSYIRYCNSWINIINQPIFPWQHRWLWVLININTHYFGNMGIVLLHHTITLIPWNNIIIVFYILFLLGNGIFCWWFILIIFPHQKSGEITMVPSRHRMRQKRLERRIGKSRTPKNADRVMVMGTGQW